jgi:hypothetical protein
MAVEALTYADLGQRLGCSPEAARSLVKRLRLPRQRANDGKTLVTVDLAEIDHKPLPARSPPGHLPVATELKAHIDLLEAELARIEAVAAGHRADFERERDRSDTIMSEALRLTKVAMAARESSARLEGQLASRQQPRSWWKRLAG